MAVSGSYTKLDFGLPELASLTESERIQVLAVMQKAKKLLNEPVLKLVEAKDVRWLSHDKATSTLMKCLPSVFTSLEREAEERNDVRAAGLAKFTQDHRFVMSLHMMCDTLPHLTELSTAMQARDAIYTTVKPLVTGTLSILRGLQTTPGESYQCAEQRVADLQAQGFNIKPPSEPETVSFREKVFNPFMENIVENLEGRFPDLPLIQKFDVFNTRKFPDSDDNSTNHGEEDIKEFDMKEEVKNKGWRPLEGQLTKFTNVMKGWLPRWFILDPESGMLEYFEKEEHKKQKPRGSLHLAAAVVSPSEEDSQTFTVSAANGEVYKLRASDAKERQQWVDRLRSTSEHHTSYMAQRKSRPKNLPAVEREVRSSSISLSSSSLASSSTQKTKKGLHGSNESIPSVTYRPPSVTKAPMAHPHTIDPFKEVKEYMMEAEDYSASLTEKISILPQTGQTINSLDEDMLLIKATTSATLQCLGQCLTMLQQRQEAYGVLQTVPSVASSSVDMSPRRDSRTRSTAESIPSPVGSFTSAIDLPLILPESAQPEGPINHEEEVEDEAEYKDKDLEGMEEHKSIILHLLSQLKLGMDLTKVVLPTFILERRSLLELFADCMAHPDVFLRITNLAEPEDRMMAVLEWYLTSFHAGRQGSIAKKPYNPIIGETFHCSWKIPPQKVGSEGDQGEGEPFWMTYTAEQVSHHPPVSAFYFECPKRNVCINASIWTKSKFMGMSIGVVMVGKVVLKLLDFDEEYVFGLPSAYARSILTTPWVELGDKIQLTCQKTNMNASVIFHTKPFYGGKLHRVTAEVKNGNTGNICCKVQGEWNSQFEFTYANGETKVIDVHDNRIWRKRVRPVEKQGDFESRKLWQHVTNALRVGDITVATEHKKFLEERQREGERHRKDTNTQFPTKYFHKIGDTWMYKDMLQK